ncbi:MAG TPA: hydrogenase nickel incorporation protein HypB [Pirellulales bacterium]|nr:hydrogenase nickel incorporation protein HypB [Pirellulales bacterium]
MSRQVITVRRDVLEQARIEAGDLRDEMSRRGTLVVNMISSPGAGKTALLAATAQYWSAHERGQRPRMAVLVGDLATDRDAQRLAPFVPVVQMTTGGACHLELPLVKRALAALGDSEAEFLFIENVGNLVCPASHDLGEHLRVILLSATEGDDKPGKYPKAFRTSHAMVISKLDLLPYVPFSIDRAAADAREIQPKLTILPLCALDGHGIDAWCDFLETQRRELLAQPQCV